MRRYNPASLASTLLLVLGATSCQESENGPTATPVTPAAESTFQIMAIGIETGQGTLARTFLLDANSGESMPVSGLGLAGINEVRAMAVHPVTGALYAISAGNGHLVEVDVATSNIRLIGATRWGTSAMTFDGAGRLLAIRGGGLWEVNIDNAALTFVTALTTPSEVGSPPVDLPLGLQGVTFNESDGKLYGVDGLNKRLYRIDPVTGHSLPVGESNGRQLLSLAYVPEAEAFYSIDYSTRELITLDPADGSTALVGQLPGYGSWQSLCYDSNGGTLYASDTNGKLLCSIDTASASKSAVLAFGLTTFGVTYNTTAGAIAASSVSAGVVLVDPQTGLSTGIGAVTDEFGFPVTLAFDSVLGIYYGIESSALYSYDGNGENKIWIGDVPHYHSIAGLALDPVSGDVYALCTSPEQLVRISTKDASMTVLPESVGVSWLSGLAFDPIEPGLLYTYTASFDNLVSINVQTGAGTMIGRVGNSNGLHRLAFDPISGELFGSSGPELSMLMKIDKSTGAGSSIGAFGEYFTGPLTYDSLNDDYYSIGHSTQDGSRLLRVNPVTGTSTFIGTLGAHAGTLEYDSRSDTLYGYVGGTGVVAIDRTTGVTLLVSEPSMAILEMAYDPSAEVMYCIGADGLYQLVPETGATQFIAPLTGDASTTTTLTFNSSTGMLMGTSVDSGGSDEGGMGFASRDLISIDPVTGNTLSIGQLASSIGGIAFKP